MSNHCIFMYTLSEIDVLSCKHWKYESIISNNVITFQRESVKTVQWRCSVRQKVQHCYTSVTQKGDIFHRGTSKHNHPADNMMKKRVLLKRDVSIQEKFSLRFTNRTVQDILDILNFIIIIFYRVFSCWYLGKFWHNYVDIYNL